MTVQPSNHCPACKKMPDIPGDLLFAREGSITWGSPDCFCNRCGAHLEVSPTEQGWSTIRVMKGRDDLEYDDEFLDTYLDAEIVDDTYLIAARASELSPRDIRVSLWMFRARVFISYSHKDIAWCEPFAGALQRAKFSVFFDSGSISPSEDWVQKIGQEIERCDFFIPVLTPDAWAAEWVQREISLAYAAERTILPVLLKETSVTGFLRTVQQTNVLGKNSDQAADLVAEAIRSAPVSSARRTGN